MYETPHEAIKREYDDLIAAYHNGELHQSELNRMNELETVMNDMPGGGAECEMIKEEDFVEYTQQLVEECYEMPREYKDSNDWPWRHITFDWKAAAEDLKSDYTPVEFEGTTYYCREI